MYNTLKEIQNSLSNKDINKYVGKLSGKTAKRLRKHLNQIILEYLLKQLKNLLIVQKKLVQFQMKNQKILQVVDEVVIKIQNIKSQRFKRYFSTSRNYRYYTIEDIRGYNSYKKSYLYVVKPDDSDGRQERYLDIDDHIVLI